jgi:hypothetical protein
VTRKEKVGTLIEYKNVAYPSGEEEKGGKNYYYNPTTGRKEKGKRSNRPAERGCHKLLAQEVVDSKCK